MTATAPVDPGSNRDVELAPSFNRFALREATAGPAYAMAEVTCLALMPYIGSHFYNALMMPGHQPSDRWTLAVGLIMASLYLLLDRPNGTMAIDDLRSASLRRPLTRWFVAFMFFTLASFALKIGADFSRGGMLTGFLLGTGFIVMMRLAAPMTIDTAFRHRLIEGRRTIMISDGSPLPPGLAGEDLTLAGFSVQGWFPLPLPEETQSSARLDRLAADIIKRARISRAEEIVVAGNAFRNPAVADVLDRLKVLPLRVLLLVDHPHRPLLEHKTRSDILDGAIEIRKAPGRKAERSMKRWLDAALAALLIVLASPLLIAIAIAIRLDSKGPVLFRQTRVGFAGRTFMIYKFRSMRTLDNGSIVQQARRGDQRITRVGRVLRASSLDELPQLFNVLIGDMSLVGPRPHALAHDQHYEHLITDYAWRHHAVPGITGWAQVNGHRGETPTLATMEARVEHDLWYVANWSIWLDLKILVMTIGAVMKPTNAY
jgi:Undecaprenyl-phosphate glucose phosphotransferase